MTEEARLVICAVILFSVLAVSTWKFFKPLSVMFGGWSVVIAMAAVGVMPVEAACLSSGVLFVGAVFAFGIQSGIGMPGLHKETRAKYVLVSADWENDKLYAHDHHEFVNGLTHNGRMVVQDEQMRGSEVARAYELVHPHVWKHRPGADLEFYEARVDFLRREMVVTYFDNAAKNRQMEVNGKSQFNSAGFCTAFNHAPLVNKTFKLSAADLKVD